MSKLEEFLGLGNSRDITEEIAVKLGEKDFTLKIRVLTTEEHTEFQRRATVVSKKSINFDKGKYNSLVLPVCIIEPNFNDAVFLEKAKCQTAWEFISNRFPAGVVEDISKKIQELSGFETFEMEIENAKN